MNIVAPVSSFRFGIIEDPICKREKRTVYGSQAKELDINPKHRLPPKPIEQGNTKYAFWKKAVAGVLALTAIAALAIWARPRSYPPTPCDPGIDPNCSGPLRQRIIKIGTVYDNGSNPDRQKISDFVDNSHKIYAKEWGLIHEIVRKNLVAKKCLHPRTNAPIDCNVYVNKLWQMLEWVSEPVLSDGIEEWRVYLDDDMPITNMKIGMNEIIDKLRNGKDASVILVEDVHDWQKLYPQRMGNHVPHASVNTGLIIMRKDAEAKAFMEEVWRHRNDVINAWDDHCLTLGQCQGTIDSAISLLDQEMVGTVLAKHPKFMDKTVLVVPPRDASSPTRGHIALNTLNWKNFCYSKCENGRAMGPPGFFGQNAPHPEWLWEPGDFCGQPAGVYMVGKEFPLTPTGCPSNNYRTPCTTPRLNRIQEQIAQTIDI